MVKKEKAKEVKKKKLEGTCALPCRSEQKTLKAIYAFIN